MSEAVSRGTPQDRIGLVSFTRAAAHELAERAGVKPGKNISTLHSYAFRICGLIREQVVDRGKLAEFSKASKIQTTGANVYDQESLGPGDYYLGMYNYMKSRMITCHRQAFNEAGRQGSLVEFGYFIRAYESWKEGHGYFDFSDMIEKALGQPAPDLDILFLDEAQDFSPAQWRLIQHWSPHIDQMLAAGDDDQCQPTGTKVLTPSGEVAIESLKDGDEVVAYSNGYMAKRRVKVASRRYNGPLVNVKVGDKESSYTPDHICMVRYKPDLWDWRVVYLMQRGPMFRIGQTKLVKRNRTGVSLYPIYRARQEKADRLWLLETTDCPARAHAREKVLGVKYGIPETLFHNNTIGIRTKYETEVWDEYMSSGVDFKERAGRLLEEKFKSLELPILKQSGGTKHIRCYAFNLDPNIHQLATMDADGKLVWHDFELSRTWYKGHVHSLGVEKSKTYFGDGIFTHNCLYVFSGADPRGMSTFEEFRGTDRVILDRSHRVPSEIHRVADRLISNVHDRVQKRYLPVREGGTVRRFGSVQTVPAPDGNDDTLVLFRNHSLRDELEEWLQAKCVPYITDNGRKGPLQSPLAAAITSWEILKENMEHCGQAMLSPKQTRAIKRLAQPIYVSKIDNEDFESLVAKEWWQVLRVPNHLVRYYRALQAKYGTPLPNTKVHLSTIHGSKGREADRVILLNAMSHLTAEFSTKNPDTEIRAFYVGVTRARDTLDIVTGDNPLALLK